MPVNPQIAEGDTSLAERVKHAILRRVRARVKDVLFFVVLPRTYRNASRQPVSPGKVLFLENKESEIPESFQVMWSRLSDMPGLTLEFV